MPDISSAADVCQSSKAQNPDRFLNFPEELRKLQQWVGATEDKTPIQVSLRTGAFGCGAMANVPNTWSMFDSAVQAIGKESKPINETNHGTIKWIGFEFHPKGDVFGIDLDNCIDLATGKIAPRALAIVALFPNMYWEISISGTGLHGVGRGRKPGYLKAPPLTSEKSTFKKSDSQFLWTAQNDNGHSSAIEIYDSTRYFTVSGNRLPGSGEAVVEYQDQLSGLCIKLWPPESLLADLVPAAAPPNTPASNGSFEGSDEQLWQAMFRAQNGPKIKGLYEHDPALFGAGKHYPSVSEGFAALMGYLASYTCKDPVRMEQMFGQSNLARYVKDGEVKWNRPKIRTDLIEKAIAGCTWVWTPKPKQQGVAEIIGPDDIKPLSFYKKKDQADIIPGFLAEGSLEVWYAASGAGKSTVLTSVLYCIANGLPFAGIVEDPLDGKPAIIQKRKAMLFDGGENPMPAVEFRIKEILKLQDEGELRIWGEWVPEGRLPLPSVKLNEWIGENDPKPVIGFDNLLNFFGGDSENDSAQINNFFKMVKEGPRARGAACVVLHNMGKDGNYRGSSAIRDAADVVRCFEAELGEDLKIQSITITTEKNRMVGANSLPATFTLRLDSKTGGFSLDTAPASPKAKKADEQLLELLKENSGCGKEEFKALAAKKGIAGTTKAGDFIGRGLKGRWIIEKSDQHDKKLKRISYQKPPEPEPTDPVAPSDDAAEHVPEPREIPWEAQDTENPDPNQRNLQPTPF